jgi:hypothetical protein
VVPPAVGPLSGETPVTVGVTALYVKLLLRVAVWPLWAKLTSTVPAMWAGVTAWTWLELKTFTEPATVPPNRTVAPDAKFEPLIVTVVPPEVAPDCGEMPLSTGDDGGAMLASRLAEAVAPVESFTWAVNENDPAWVGVPVIAPVLELSARPAGSVPPLTLQL